MKTKIIPLDDWPDKAYLELRAFLYELQGCKRPSSSCDGCRLYERCKSAIKTNRERMKEELKP